MARPGLLLYFDVLPALDKLPHAAVGELLLGALHYAQDGVEPTFEDSSLEFAWAFLRPSVDRDGATYESKQLKGEWLAYCKQCKRDNAQPLDFDTWCERVDNGTLHTVDVSLQTPTAPKPTTTPSPNNIEGADKPPTPARRKHGAYGWVRLTDDEYARLVSDLGQAELDRCIQYIDESAQGNGNKNRWKDWNLVIRRCSREGWGRSKPQQNARDRLHTDADYMGGGDFLGGET